MPNYKITLTKASQTTQTSTLIFYKTKNNIKLAYEEANQIYDEIFPTNNGLTSARYCTVEELVVL